MQDWWGGGGQGWFCTTGPVQDCGDDPRGSVPVPFIANGFNSSQIIHYLLSVCSCQSSEDWTHHAVVEPLRDEVVQKFGVDQFSVVQVESPERKHHKLEGDGQKCKVSGQKKQAELSVQTFF